MKSKFCLLLVLSLVGATALHGADGPGSTPVSSPPVADDHESVDQVRQRMLRLFDFPISQAIGIDVKKIVRPAPKIYHLTYPIVR